MSQTRRAAMRWFACCALALLGMASGATAAQATSAAPEASSASVSTPRVNAERYDAFWLWAGVRPQPVLDRARTVYLLQGEVKAEPAVRFVSRLSATPKITHADVWLVVRAETLHWTPQIRAQLLERVRRWREAGNRVVGVQIDFDARTRHLDEYAEFLKGLRRSLPKDCKLGITGLLDWSANGDPRSLTALAGVVDEVVLQIYQGRRVIPGYRDYLARLDRLALPFRIGLLQGGEWDPPPSLRKHPYFRGYVLFLRNP
ncbi:MAG: DUF3142 domain-containing protein [Lysobacter sp.]|nr:DUF3142 domain-containing protein [Lysobacter sp.]